MSKETRKTILTFAALAGCLLLLIGLFFYNHNNMKAYESAVMATAKASIKPTTTILPTKTAVLTDNDIVVPSGGDMKGQEAILDDKPYDINLTSALAEDMTKAMNYAVEGIDVNQLGSDAMFCSVVIDRDTFETKISTFYRYPKFQGKLTDWFKLVMDNYDGLLCQNYTGNFPNRKTIVVWKGQMPLSVYAEDGKHGNVHNLNNDVVSVMSLYPHPMNVKSELVLSNRTSWNVMVDHPGLYLDGATSKLVYDIK